MSGVELTVASALMGHADIQTTANIYNDVQQEQKELAAQKVAAYMNDNEPGERSGELVRGKWGKKRGKNPHR